jgi:hypothetical protein
MTSISVYRSCKAGGDIMVKYSDEGDNLPYMQLIERCGDRIKDLSFHLEKETQKKK